MVTTSKADLRATQEKDEAYNDMLRLLGSSTGIIDGYGKATDDPGVWARAGFAEPKKGGPRPAPPVPTVGETITKSDGSVLF